MSEDDKIPYEDYDEWEADYYARKSSGGLFGCVFLAAFLLAALVITLLFTWIKIAIS